MLASMNAAIYIVFVVAYTAANVNVEQLAITILGSLSIILSILFLSYGGCLFYTFWRIKEMEIQDSLSRPFSSSADDGEVVFEAASASTSSPMVVQPSASDVAAAPMRKLLIVSIFCNLCFLFRGVVLLLGGASWLQSPLQIVLYFVFSEVLPLSAFIFSVTLQ